MRRRWTPAGLRGFADVAVPWIVGLFLVLVALGEGEDGAPAGVLLLIALAVVQAVALRSRRTHPIPVTAVALVGGLAVLAISPDSVMPVAGYFAVGALASIFPPRVSLFGLAGVTAVASINFFSQNAEDAVFAIVLGFGAWALGEAARNRKVVIHEEARRAVADEQARSLWCSQCSPKPAASDRSSSCPRPQRGSTRMPSASASRTSWARS
jgi:hypothetical protein